MTSLAGAVGSRDAEHLDANVICRPGLGGEARMVHSAHGDTSDQPNLSTGGNAREWCPDES
jgi:hypothetical protein